MTKGSERAGIYAGDSSHGIRIYNNTFYLDGTQATLCYGITLNSGAGTNVVENNIFYFINWTIQDALVGTGGNSIDYNLYYPAKDSGDNGLHTSAGDPLFKTTGSDFHLTPLSVARKSALTLSFFDTDFDGTLRPAGGWDRGAFQFDSLTSAREAPEEISRQPIASVTRLSRDRFIVRWNMQLSPEQRYRCRIFTSQGVLVALLQSNENVTEWNNSSHLRGMLVFCIDNGETGISRPILVP